MNTSSSAGSNELGAPTPQSVPVESPGNDTGDHGLSGLLAWGGLGFVAAAAVGVAWPSQSTDAANPPAWGDVIETLADPVAMASLARWLLALTVASLAVFFVGVLVSSVTHRRHMEGLSAEKFAARVEAAQAEENRLYGA